MVSKEKQSFLGANSRQTNAEQKGGDQMSLQEIAEQNGFQEFYRTKVDKETSAFYFQKPGSNEYLEIDVSKTAGQTEWMYFVEHDGNPIEIVGHGHQSYDLEKFLSKGWRAESPDISEDAKDREQIEELDRKIQELELKLTEHIIFGHYCKKCHRKSILDETGTCYNC